MVFVVSRTGVRLMPATEYRARKLLKSGRAVVFRRDPFTIRLLNRETGTVQPVEYKCDTGYACIGISICTEKRELVNAQYDLPETMLQDAKDLLASEPERHSDRRKYRRQRRNRKRHRAPRFNNRKGMTAKDGFAPSVRNKRDVHVRLFMKYAGVLPVTDAVFEMGQFDTQVMKAIAENRPLPEGTDYQRGERYGTATLREAVFTRDGYKCRLCGKSGISDHVILNVHHIGFWKNDRSDRMPNLMTVCACCHSGRNHKPGGKLYGLEPKLPPFAGATFMTAVRWDMLKKLKAAAPGIDVKITYGAATKLARKALSVKKTHSNDAYCMGRYHPKYRADHRYYKKLRRNNRVLEKFYDLKVIDIRTGKKVSGSQLGCGRTRRSIPRKNPDGLRAYRGAIISKGRRAIRRQRYSIRPGTQLMFNGERLFAKGVHQGGKGVVLSNGKDVSVKKVTVLCRPGGWQRIV